MKPQEAIDFINNEVDIDVRLCSEEKVEKTKEVFEFAIAAIKKQIPQKPHYIDGDYGLPLCPNCHMAIDENENEGCCSVCGQALDWSDKE